MWFICDTLGIALGVLTWGLLAFADWVVVRHVFVGWFWTPRPRFSWVPLTDIGVSGFFLYQVIIALSWFSHFQAATTDPGTIKASTAPTEFPNPRICKLCQGRWKPPRAHHCKTCHRCIFRMDHHCPWINNCVGLVNQKLFILFLGYTALAAVTTLVLLASSAIYWLWAQSSWKHAETPSSAALICAGLVAVECLAAILFVSDFLQEQIESIQMNSTLVETYQRTHGERTTFGTHFRAIFGDNLWLWPVPVALAQPTDYTEPVFPDDHDVSMLMEDTDSLGIAGEDTEGDVAVGSAVAGGEGLRARHRGFGENAGAGT